MAERRNVQKPVPTRNQWKVKPGDSILKPDPQDSSRHALINPIPTF